MHFSNFANLSYRSVCLVILLIYFSVAILLACRRGFPMPRQVLHLARWHLETLTGQRYRQHSCRVPVHRLPILFDSPVPWLVSNWAVPAAVAEPVLEVSPGVYAFAYAPTRPRHPTSTCRPAGSCATTSALSEGGARKYNCRSKRDARDFHIAIPLATKQPQFISFLF